MDTIEAIKVLDDYKLKEKAEAEIKRKKMDKAPLNMVGRNEIYCRFLDKKYIEIKQRLEEMKKVRCHKWDELEDKPLHDECTFAFIILNGRGVCANCELGKEIEKKRKEMERLDEASKTLHEAAVRDYNCR